MMKVTDQTNTEESIAEIREHLLKIEEELPEFWTTDSKKAAAIVVLQELRWERIKFLSEQALECLNTELPEEGDDEQ